MTGLRVYIYKTGGRDFSNGGISSKADELVLVNVAGTSAPSAEAPAALLLENVRGTVRVVPAKPSTSDPDVYVAAEARDFLGVDGVGPMMGGSYVAAPGSSFTEAVERIVGHPFYGAVPLHDRFETERDYALNFP